MYERLLKVWKKDMDLEFKKISITKSDSIGIITLNHPEIQNVISFETLVELDRALKLLEFDEKIRVILLKAVCAVSKNNAKIFSAGINLKEYEQKFKLIDENPVEFEKTLKQSRALLSRIEMLKKPVIAGVDGLALGGAFELILACDLILASDEAQFALNEINLGLIPSYGGVQRLIRSIGKKKTFEIVASGRILSAQEALIVGVVAEIYSDSDFNKRLIEYCKKMSQKSAQSLWLIKDTINQLTFKAIHDEIEVKNFIKAASARDAREGINAFMEKRVPKFD